MRIDKFIGECGILTRGEASKAVRGGRVFVNNIAVKDPSTKIDEKNDTVTLDGKILCYKKFRYIMLNKPSGYVSTTEDDEKSVMKLLPLEYRRMEMFPCGRLDIDTTGILIITNDGQSAHELLSPKKHCEKVYDFDCLPLTDEMISHLENGVELKDFISKPCKLEMRSVTSGRITVTEGKYHQIKRMFLAVGSEIVRLERAVFAGIPLDTNLKRGEWRELTSEEIELLTKNQK